jgi:hypothetical protein
MTTKRQIAANRRNARKSTGPRTEEGKKRSSRNAITHGLVSRQVLLREEDPDLFRAVREEVWAELRPMGEVETYLAARVVSGIWRMNRIVRIEAQLFNEAPLREVDAEVGIGKIFRLDCAHGGSAFAKLLRYETAIDRGIHGALRELRGVQAARRAGEEEEWQDALPAGANGHEREFPFEAILTEKQAGRGSAARRDVPSAPNRRKGQGNGGQGRPPQQNTGASAPPLRSGTSSEEGDGTRGKLRKEPSRPPGRARQGSAGDQSPAGGALPPAPEGGRATIPARPGAMPHA